MAEALAINIVISFATLAFGPHDEWVKHNHILWNKTYQYPYRESPASSTRRMSLQIAMVGSRLEPLEKKDLFIFFIFFYINVIKEPLFFIKYF